MLVSSEDNHNKVKSIISMMSKSNVNLEEFFEILEKESSGKITFSHFKSLFDQYYEIIPKNDRLYFLKNVQMKATGLINIYELFDFFSETLIKTIPSPIFAYYKFAYKIEKLIKTSTLEFIYNIGLTLDNEITLNDFLLKIGLNLRLEDIYANMVFKGLDYKKKGRVLIEDFVLVIDSYRDDLLEILGTGEEDGMLINNYIFEDHIKNFYVILEQNYIHIEEIFRNINEDNPDDADYIDVYNYLKTELEDKISESYLKNILSLIKTSENKIAKTDLEHLIDKMKQNKMGIVKGEMENKDSNTNKREDLIHLKEADMLWIKKLLNVLNDIAISPTMVFYTVNKDNEGKAFLDSFRKKLRLMIPQEKLDSLEINFIIKALDINGDQVLSQQDFNDVLNKVRRHFENENKNNHDYSVNYSISTPKKMIDPMKSFNNTFNHGRKSANFHLLPIKGNYKILATIRNEKSQNKNLEQSKLISNSVTSPINNNKSKDFTKPHDVVPKSEKNTGGFLFKDEKLYGTQASTFSMNIQSQSISPDKLNNSTKLLKFDDFNLVDISLIDILEGINIRTNGITSYELYRSIAINYENTEFTKRHFYEFIKAVDSNKDGIISYIDLINFLLKYFKHRSTTLGLKEVIRKIQYEIKTTTEDYFVTKGHNDLHQEFPLNSFTDFLSKHFEIEQPIAKKMYEDYRLLTPNKKTLHLGEIFDLINSFREEEKTVKNLDFNMADNNLLINKKYFEDSIIKFVSQLCESGFGEKNTSEGLMENLKYAVNLPDSMTILEFKNSFIKPLKMDYSLGVAIFQLLKTFTNKNEQVMTKNVLFMFLESYTSSNLFFDTAKKNQNIESIVMSIEKNGCPIIYCLEAIDYSNNGIL